MAAEYDWLTLEADEEVLWADTPHPYSLVPALVVGIPLSLLVVGLVVVAAAYLQYTNTNYAATSTALYRKTGVLSRSVQRIEFDKVQDTSYRQSFLGARFGFGTVDVSTAGGSGVEMSFGSVADPRGVQATINERLRDRRGRAESERDADAVLADVLDELRAIRRAVEAGSTDVRAGRPAGGDAGPRDDPADGA